MNNKRVRGNKEAKKPKREAPVSTPAVPATAAVTSWPKPRQAKK